MSQSAKQVKIVELAEPQAGRGFEPTALFNEDGTPWTGGGGAGEPVTWASITGKPATFTPTVGATATTAMAGNTALLQIGTTATTAKAGDYVPTWADVTGKPTTFAPATHTHVVADVTGLQAIIDDLETRLAALEAAEV